MTLLSDSSSSDVCPSTSPLAGISIRRVDVASAALPCNSGIRIRYPIENASWVWHPDLMAGQEAFVRFSLPLHLDRSSTITLDLSADQRYQLQVDGQWVGSGPDRAEIGGWAFHRYELSLPAGSHELAVLVWWLNSSHKPVAQLTIRGGFVCHAHGEWDALISTGKAPWQASIIPGIQPHDRAERLGFYHAIGCSFRMNGDQLQPEHAKPAAVIHTPWDDRSGQASGRWRLEPSCLPEQQRRAFHGGRIRVVAQGRADRFDRECDAQESQTWAPLTTGKPVTIPSHSHLTLLWDLEDYLCAYPQIILQNGAGSTVEIAWAERLQLDESRRPMPADDRSQVQDRFWLGFGDQVLHDGGLRTYSVPWWRSGRYVRLVATTSDEPLTIIDARPIRTEYPYDPAWKFDGNDPKLPSLLAMCEHTLRQCMHETFVDCPYYEQLNYVGDTRLQALVFMATSFDDRLVRRCLTLFDRSRWFNGFVAERCPSDPYQASSTYSLIWTLMLRDYAWWRNDPNYVRQLLVGNRCMLEQALAHRDALGLLGQMPGWTFVDWVKREDWQMGIPPGVDPGPSSIVSLHLLLALEAASQLERYVGEGILADRYDALAGQLLDRVIEVFWDDARGMLADDTDHHHWSEHAQALALCSSLLSAEHRSSLLDALAQPTPDMAKATVYFSFYVLQALAEAYRGDQLLARLEFWHASLKQNLLTTPEAPSPSRSDCHAWGAHPLYFALTALAGVKPDGPGFERVRIEPCLSSLPRLKAVVPHPKGMIEVDLHRHGDKLLGSVTLPVGLSGTFTYTSQKIALAPGINEISA